MLGLGARPPPPRAEARRGVGTTTQVHKLKNHDKRKASKATPNSTVWAAPVGGVLGLGAWSKEILRANFLTFVFVP